ncbi:MAG: SDR family NAD(P)-dependent oxidoreductase [Candidatus Eremiobacteraeota bacterium]|nr:SDR family NAD(P)-dependent oxidoreductase [Candidatus Eremiobacteraeota bacterium]MCW5872357.1 SDR family NAD(P)-dependent oxidoreductase [Candidatus Eremiobacteraeota bacterium]
MRILISGNRRGLGAALTDYFSEQGHQVWGFSQASAPPNRVDASDFGQVRDWVESVVHHYGAPDLVLANAATVLSPAPLAQVEPEDFSRLIDVNVKGVFYLFRAVLPHMTRGVLIGISSGYGRTTSPRMGPYCTSKWAVEGLVKTLASELPKTMAAVALDPGTLQTDMLRQALGEGARFFPTPDQWVDKAARLILGLGPAHNGQSLSV